MRDHDVEALVREAAPTPDAETARRIDDRVAAVRARSEERVPARASWTAAFGDRLRGLGWRPAVGALCGLAIAAVLVVTGVHGLDRRGDGGDAAPSSGAASVAAPVGGVAPESLSAPQDVAAGAKRRVRRAAAVRIGVRHVADAAGKAMGVADQFDGLVMRTDIETGAQQPHPTAHLDLRVPTGQLGRALAALSRLGVVRDRTQSSADVTARFNATEAELAEARAERRSLLDELSRAVDEAARAEVRRRLALNRLRLERAGAARQRIGAATRLARIDVTLEQAGDASASPARDDRWGIGDALRDAGRVLSVAGAALVLVAALMVPAALLGFLVALGARGVRRRWRAHGLDTA